jgi:anti-sigma regulatory factor (Ser/Thr protein kinase)
VADVLDMAIPAQACAPWRVRRAVSDWLGGLCGVSPLCDTGEDLVYAVSEAVANCVDHAYSGDGPGAVTVTVTGHIVRLGGARSPRVGCLGPFRIELAIGDSGRWKEPAREPGDRGRGLRMIEAFVDALEVDRARTGTTVTVRQLMDCPAHRAR